MRTSNFTLALGLAIGLLGTQAQGAEYVDCNMNGLDKMSAAQADHVFYARLGDKGQGNGGEAVDATFDADIDLVTKVTCVSTANEDTGGALTIDPYGIVFDPSEALPEADPGYTTPDL